LENQAERDHDCIITDSTAKCKRIAMTGPWRGTPGG
jgi:hypothetical protein